MQWYQKRKLGMSTAGQSAATIASPFWMPRNIYWLNDSTILINWIHKSSISIWMTQSNHIAVGISYTRIFSCETELEAMPKSQRMVSIELRLSIIWVHLGRTRIADLLPCGPYQYFVGAPKCFSWLVECDPKTFDGRFILSIRKQMSRVQTVVTSGNWQLPFCDFLVTVCNFKA